MSDIQVGDVVRYVASGELHNSVWVIRKAEYRSLNWWVLADPLFTPAVYTNARRIPLLTKKLEKIPNAK